MGYAEIAGHVEPNKNWAQHHGIFTLAKDKNMEQPAFNFNLKQLPENKYEELQQKRQRWLRFLPLDYFSPEYKTTINPVTKGVYSCLSLSSLYFQYKLDHIIDLGDVALYCIPAIFIFLLLFGFHLAAKKAFFAFIEEQLNTIFADDDTLRELTQCIKQLRGESEFSAQPVIQYINDTYQMGRKLTYRDAIAIINHVSTCIASLNASKNPNAESVLLNTINAPKQNI